MTLIRGKKSAVAKPRIQSENDLDRATEELCVLLSLERDLSPEEEQRFRLLTDAVENYERVHHPIQSPSHAGLLEHLLDVNGSSQQQLSKAAKIPISNIAAILSGKRLIPPDEAERFAQFFCVDRSVFRNDLWVIHVNGKSADRRISYFGLLKVERVATGEVGKPQLAINLRLVENRIVAQQGLVTPRK
jgi:antitoxin component HigA of HigAB toxin-antitoxin module